MSKRHVAKKPRPHARRRPKARKNAPAVMREYTFLGDNAGPSKEQRLFLEEIAKEDATLARDPSFAQLDPFQKLQRRGRPLRQVYDLFQFEKRKHESLSKLDDLEGKISDGHINALRELILIAHETTSRVAKSTTDTVPSPRFDT